MSKKLTRREFLKRSAILGTGVAGAAILNACAPAPTPVPPPAPTTAPAAPTTVPAAPTTAPAVPTAVPPTAVPKPTVAAFDWKRFKGQHIEVNLIKNAQGDVIAKYTNEFQDLTGITVGLQEVPEQQQRPQMVVEFNSGNPSFDVVYYSFHTHKRMIGKNKWTEDIRPYLQDPTMTAPDYAYDDFSVAGKAWMTEPDGRIDSFCCNIAYGFLMCNKEIFAAKNVPLPKTFDDMLAAAKTLHDPSKNVYGFVGRGLKNANTYVWCCLILGWDIDAIDSKLNLNTETPEAVASATFYQNLMKYAPPGVSGFNWNESQSVFALGQAAMWFDSIGFAAPLEDPKVSKVVGKVAYLVAPAGPKKQWAGMTGDGIGISSTSKNKGPAYFYCQWATNKLMQARSFAAGAGAMPRDSVYTDPQALASVTMPKDWLDAVAGSGKVGRPTFPLITPVTEFRDIFGVALTNMIGGADPATELKSATAQFKPILAKSEA